ncbi:MAG: acyl carrier protein [Kiritimatiellae bacterium]|nr:acyl carrier protein [Kiritimatiellia bacterium]
MPQVEPGTRFRETEGWCSLMAFGLLVMMENDYKRPLAIEEFMRLETVGELFSRISP